MGIRQQSQIAPSLLERNHHCMVRFVGFEPSSIDSIQKRCYAGLMKHIAILLTISFLLMDPALAQLETSANKESSVDPLENSKESELSKPQQFRILNADHRLKFTTGYLLNERTGGQATSVGVRISDQLYLAVGSRNVSYHHMDRFVAGARIQENVRLRGIDLTVSTGLQLWSLPMIELAAGVEYANASVKIDTYNSGAGILYEETFEGFGAVLRPSIFFQGEILKSHFRAGLGLDIRSFTRTYSFDYNGTHNDRELPLGFGSAAYVFFEALLF